MIPVFERYPLLRDKLPYVSLGEFPTPVQKLDRLGSDIGLDHLYIKRDDLSGKLYGGNKIRKLEFLLGHALRAKVKGVFTFGFAGSSQSLATAICTKQTGLKSISMLKHQPNAQHIRGNLLMNHYYGAELHQHPNILFLPFSVNKSIGTVATFYQLLRYRLKYGHFPQVIRNGGSSPLGTTGFVNAAFELKQQIMQGEIPEPDCIYVAVGSMGTAVGLMLGLKAANLKSRVVCVRVVDEKTANVRKVLKLLYKTNTFLHSIDPSFPKFEFSEKDIEIRHSFLGQGYALPTKEGMEAKAQIERKEGINLEGTYTGKAFAALIDNARKQDLRDKVVLFWNTYNSRDFSDVITNADYRQLPRCFHRYFEEEV
jgi:D-cysteine desulfhydrase